MAHIKRLTTQQLIMIASFSFMSVGAMLSQGSKFGFIPLGLAIISSIGAFVKSKKAKPSSKDGI